MTTEAQFLAEAERRGHRREEIFLLPGPDERRNPEGGVVVEAPRAGAGGAWRTYRMDRGVQDEARFDTASAAYDHVLATVFALGAAPPLTRERFLAEVTQRGGKASWFVFLDDGSDDPSAVPNGRVVIAHEPGPPETWRTYVQDRGVRDPHRSDSESAALQHLLGTMFGR